MSALCWGMAAAFSLATTPLAHAQANAAVAKKRIDKAADLPRFSYPAKGNLETWVRDEAVFAPLPPSCALTWKACSSSTTLPTNRCSARC